MFTKRIVLFFTVALTVNQRMRMEGHPCTVIPQIITVIQSCCQLYESIPRHVFGNMNIGAVCLILRNL